MRAVGSYYEVPNQAYQAPPAGTPGWQLAPVPGWGMNPYRAGPPVLATNGSILPRYTPVQGLGDSEQAANEGYIALSAALGLFTGWFLCWAYHYNQKQKRSGR